MEKQIKLLSIPVLLFVFFSCTKKKIADTPSSGTALIGSISGKVKVIKPQGTTFFEDMSNVRVTVSGQIASAITDANGSYTIQNVNAGILDVSFIGSDGAVKKVRQLSFVGNGNLLLNQNLSRKCSDTLFATIRDSIDSGHKALFVKSFLKSVNSNSSQYLTVLFGTSPEINPNDASTYVYGFAGYLQLIGSKGEAIFSKFFAYPELAMYTGIKSGQKLYVKTYNTSNGGVYYDPFNDKSVYYSAGNAAVANSEFVMP